MYNNILVPISFDEERNAEGAIEVAQALRAEGGKITLLHVMEHIPGYAVSYIPEDLIQATREGAHKELDAMAEKVGNAEGVLTEGHSGRTILDWAEAKGNDCIVIASHRPGMQDLFLGSTASQVVRHATCSVHVVR